jgi:hypothetical protein
VEPAYLKVEWNDCLFAPLYFELELSDEFEAPGLLIWLFRVP